MITIYGIKNCDTCRKALKWLAAEHVEHRFHDFRADGLDSGTLSTWIKALGWEQLLNRRGTTWRNLPAEDKDAVDEAAAAKLMESNPTLIKRPVIDLGDAFVVGFKNPEQEAIRAQAEAGQ
ncbi:MAG: ArsC family reductase [Alphaproteobacteria bacterium]|nr:ArsC family reductase [Alphaproteobacteria bacterium]